MNSWQCMCEVAKKKGHEVEYQIYQRPNGGSKVFYILSIDGVKYIKKWPEQENARKKLMEICMEV